MNINLTCIIQIANFWATYFILHKFLFKPIVHHLHQKEYAKNTLLEKLKIKEKKLLVLQEKKSSLLFDFRKHLQATYASPIFHPQFLVSDVSYTKNPEEIKMLVNSSKNLLVKKVADAYSA